MVQEVRTKPNAFGRLGKGLGEALAEQVPKEVERYRLSQGLNNLAENTNQSPLKSYAQAASIPGITPQMLAALPEILRQQQQRNLYNNGRGKVEQQPQPQSTEPVGNATQTPERIIEAPQATRSGEGGATKASEGTNNNAIVEQNPLNQQLAPYVPPTPKEYRDRVAEKLDLLGGYGTIADAENMVKNDIELERQNREAYRAKQSERNTIREGAITGFNKELNLKLQKSGPGIFTDLSGEQISGLHRGLANDIQTSNITVPDAVNKWTNKALDIAKTNKLVESLSQEYRFPEEIIKKLKSHQKVYADGNNEEAYSKKMISDFKMSPQKADVIAFPRSPQVKSYLEKAPKTRVVKNNYVDLPQNAKQTSAKIAQDISRILTSKDSLLAIAEEAKQRDPYFDEESYFDYLRDNQDEIGFNPRQQRELGVGEQRLLPTWGDMWYFPFFNRKSKAHD